ncbi:MAG: extracellular solute-binding protein [Phycisphaerae bacterium]|nr:extracellular solute-binding protein [Phycisphaerae bacterium]
MRTIFLSLAVAGLLCASAPGQSRDVRFDENAAYELDIVTWTADRETEGLTWQWLVQEYQRFRPNVRVRKSIQSNQTYQQWATTQFVSGTAPDIMQSFAWVAHQWGAEQGYLTPLRRHLNSPNPHDSRDPTKYRTWMDGLYEELLELNADPYTGDIWTIPINLNTQRFYYNKRIFKNYDLKVPETFSELGRVCRQVRERSGGAIVPMAMANTGAWLDYLGAGVNAHLIADYDMIKPDYSVTENEVLVAALRGMWNADTDGMYSFHQFLKQMNDEGWFQEGWTGFDTNQADNLFTNGKAAIIREGYWMKQGFEKRIAGEFEFGIMREPIIDAEFTRQFGGRNLGRMLEMMGSYGSELAVTQSCVDRGRLPAAIDFLQWMTSPEVALKVSQMRGSMPSTRDLDAWLPDEVMVFKPEVGGRPGGPIFYNMDKAMQDCFQKVAPLYTTGDMELGELKAFMGRFQDRFVQIKLRTVQESTHTGLATGARLYAQFMIRQDDLSRRIAEARSAGTPTEMLVEQRRRVLVDAATTADNVKENEAVVMALVEAAYPEQGAAGYRHRPLVSDSAARLIQQAAMAVVGLLLAVVAVVLMRKGRIARIIGYPEKSVYAFILPTLLFVLAFSYYPAMSGIYHAFTRWDGSGVDEFTGLANLREMLTDQILAVSAANLLWMIVAFFIKLAPPLICAVVLYHVASARLRHYFRIMFVLPMIVPSIVYWMVWKLLYKPAPSGIFNQILIPLETWLRNAGLEVQLSHNWIADPRTALGAVIFLGFPWVGTLGVLIYLAGLENIDPGLFEAADMDGAGWLRKFWYIELPLLMRQVKLNLVLGIIGTIQGYGTILFLTQGGPAFSTTVPGYQMYDEAFKQMRMGYASAIGLVMFLVILAATMTTSRAVKPQD